MKTSDLASSFNTETGLQALVNPHQRTGNNAATEELYRKNVERCRLLGPSQLAEALYDLGRFYEETGRYTEAEPTFQQALELDRQAFGPDSLEVAQDLNGLAMLYEHTKRQNEAEAAYIRSIEIKRLKLGSMHNSLALGLHNLAMLYLSQDLYANAEPLLLEALQIRQQILIVNDPDIARILRSLGKLYLASGDIPKALQSLEQAREIYITDLPKNRQAVLDIQIDMARAMLRSGEPKQAEGLWIDVLNKTMPGTSTDLALRVAALEGLFDLYDQELDFSRARQIMHELLPEFARRNSTEHQDFTSRLKSLVRVAEQVFPTDEIAIQLFDVGEDFYNLGEYTIALALYHESHQRLSEDDFLFLVVEYAMANMHRTIGNYTEAEAILRNALERYAVSEDDLRDMLDEIDDDVEISFGDLVDYSGYYSLSAELLGSVLADTGRYEDASTWYQKGLDLELLKRTQSLPRILGIKQRIANLHQKTGDFEFAKRLLEEVIHQAREGGIQIDETFANLLSSAGSLYSNIGDFVKAEEQFTEALRIARLVSPPGDSWLAVHLNNLGYHFLNMGQHDKARLLLEDACQLWRSTLGPDHPNYAEGLNNLANLYAQQGDINAAGKALVEVLRIRMDKLGFRHPATAQTYNNLGNLYLQIGSYDKAEALLQLALSIRKDVLGSTHPSIAITLTNLINAYAHLDRLSEALAALQQQTVVHRTMIGRIFHVASERQRLALLALLQPHLRSMLWVIWRIAQELPSSVPDCFDLLIQRKGISQEALAIQQIELLKDRYPARIADFQHLGILRQQIAAIYLSGSGSGTTGVNSPQLVALESEKEKLEIALAQHVPEIDIAIKLQQADHKTIASHLPPGSALVEFAAIPNKDGDGTERYLAFVLIAGQSEAVQLIDLGDANFLEAKLSTWRSVVTGHDEQLRNYEETSQIANVDELRAGIEETKRIDESRYKTRQPRDGVTQGIELRRLVFDPIVPALGSTRRLLIAPDGDLSRLPFEALPLDQERYLLEEYQISYLSVGRDILRFGLEIGRTPSAPLVIAAPDYDMGYCNDLQYRLNYPFTQLGGLRSEGQAIATQLRTSALMEINAHKGALKNHPSPIILHLATHGFFLGNSPHQSNNAMMDELNSQMNNRLESMRQVDNPLLRSGLALAGANVWAQGGDLPLAAGNGILTAEDVTGLDLLSTELAVLSACETGLGQVKNGEGVFGLQRAFVIAGVKTLVMSLWKVPDEQTRRLMTLFYLNVLEKGLGRAEALRQAQLKLRQQYPKKPYYWGAFICQGDPGPLPVSPGSL